MTKYGCSILWKWQFSDVWMADTIRIIFLRNAAETICPAEVDRLLDLVMDDYQVYQKTIFDLQKRKDE